MQVIRSIAAARRMPPFRAIVRGCGLRDRLNRNSLRPPQLMSVVRPSRIGAEGMEQGRRGRRRGGEERTNWNPDDANPSGQLCQTGRAASERGLPVDRAVGMMGGPPRAYTLYLVGPEKKAARCVNTVVPYLIHPSRTAWRWGSPRSIRSVG